MVLKITQEGRIRWSRESEIQLQIRALNVQDVFSYVEHIGEQAVAVGNSNSALVLRKTSHLDSEFEVVAQRGQ